ncbi:MULTISPECIES: succinate dehydrogenase flavoprotein subunit [unclassified Peribacillus]|uniref:succinate dehydrogenase flavoprotein subunit n=1 Tax=unclassified Peribacillus TaxID=2675266 RepID=UPI001914A7BD|nr:MULTISPECIES: succinate dehydrogenase flavoprotein subunit [unclassified Peribacillus]MBK5442840.1 succinate dehydrogenase flavoprotein subunit [Peribacillus sp. TH24]MBK5462421.1 succinate dehydrogenase flavoprotein subunit [Peribacillus sp. TH27]MBK5484243.1 succinate dehydrogenase flavoprotein subunit [Peribacillus sp. TH16]MBK5500572.1 succinate dehydrogenase flavoprotein subunit [Peribacillus sp. TH14]WMX54403.1 succinate dehydrogenase flavoprotein subunit [Peribacillus sp. R9-11]
MGKGKIIIVGGGLAGLMATIKAAELGQQVDLFSLVPVKRSHSVCAQGGINGAVNTKGEGDSPYIHFDDTVYGGDFLANQPPVKAMCEAAPSIIHMFDRMGVMFNRTPEGLLDFRRFGGTQHSRTAFAGATTGQQLLYALDEQVRRYEVEGLVTKYEGWEFLGAVIDDDQTARGIVAQNLTSMEIKSFPGDAVIMASGGPGIIFGKSTNSMINTGSAASIVYQQGVNYANGEFIQIHPTAIPGDDKLRLMSESARGEGGRIWTYKDGKPWYFLEEKYPAYGNLVPRDIATREIFDVCMNMKLGINGENMVYLDLSHKDPKELDIKLGGIIEIYEKFMGEDPRKVPMKIFPAVHYSMGGLWVDYDQMTNIKGLFAAGECDYSQHGGNRLGANSLLSAIYGGSVAGPNAVKYIEGLDKTSESIPSSLFDGYEKQQQEKWNDVMSLDGNENAYVLHKELGEWMTQHVTVVRYNDKLKETDNKILELMERYKKININDTAKWSNQGAAFTRQLQNMMQLARVITIGALNRDESRGAHYKPDFPQRNDEEFMKTTMATFKGLDQAPEFHYEDIDVSLIAPRKRDYTTKH